MVCEMLLAVDQRSDPRVLAAIAEGLRCTALVELVRDALKSSGASAQGLTLGCIVKSAAAACMRLLNVPGPACLQARCALGVTLHACSEARNCTEVGQPSVEHNPCEPAYGRSPGSNAQQSCMFMRPAMT